MNPTANLLRFFASFIAPMKVEEREGVVTPRLEIYLSKGRYVLDAVRVNYSFGSQSMELSGRASTSCTVFNLPVLRD
jgi:hypothetical protein